MNTKHTSHRFSAAAALLLALAACNKSEIPDGATSPRQTPVIIEATGLYDLQPAPASRATVNGDWQGVTTVAVMMDGEVKPYDVAASDADGYKSATLSRENDPFWWTSRKPISVSAWWPLDEADITRMPAVKVAEDQSTPDAFQASDFISAENQTVEFDNPTLEFTHRTARVAVELKPGVGFTDISGATVSLTGLSTRHGNPATIRTYNASGTFEALVLPQTVSAGEPFIGVELGDGTFYFRPEKEIELAAGNRYTYTVKVNATGLTLEGCTISNWADGGGEDSTVVESSYRYDADTHTCFVSGALGLLVWAEAAREDPTLNCTLTADITLPTVAEGESNWTLVGDYDNRYAGTFDGGGHTITGLTINLPGQYYVGLFGMIDQSGTVQHLTLAGVKITGSYIVGGVAGYNDGTLTGCSVSGNVSGSDNVGGVAGVNYGTLTACYATCNVSGNEDVGGVVGYIFGTVTACYHAAGDVTGYDLVGGVVGYNNRGTVTGCYWNNNRDKGIYGDSSSGVTKVDGTAVTWVDAVDGMNTAIKTWNDGNPGNPCNWRYDETDAATPPALIPAN